MSSNGGLHAVRQMTIVEDRCDMSHEFIDRSERRRRLQCDVQQNNAHNDNSIWWSWSVCCRLLQSDYVCAGFLYRIFCIIFTTFLINYTHKTPGASMTHLRQHDRRLHLALIQLTTLAHLCEKLLMLVTTFTWKKHVEVNYLGPPLYVV